MKKNIPNDLSGFPSVNACDVEVQSNEETATEDSPQITDEKIYKKITDKNTFSFFSSAILISVVLIAVLVLGRSASQMIIDSFKFALWYGYTISTVIIIITFFLSWFLFKEIYSIIKLKTYNKLKQTLNTYQKNKEKIKDFDKVCSEARNLINFIKLNDKTIKQHQIKQTFEDIDFAENIESARNILLIKSLIISPF